MPKIAYLALLASLATPAAAGDFPGDVVLAVGDTRFGATVTGIGGYAIGADGVIATRDTFTGALSQAVLRHAGGADVLVVATGTAAPGGGLAGTYKTIGGISVAPDGAIVFRADVQSGAVEFSALFEAPADAAVERLLADGDATPFGDGSTFDLVELPVANGGLVAFRGTDSVGRQGIFTLESGTVRRVAVAGESHPSVGTFASFGGPRVAADGSVAFFVSSGGEGKAIFLRPPGGTAAPVVALGNPGPGGPFTSLDVPTIGPGGTVVFRGRVGPAATGIRGLFAVRAGVIERVALEGQPTPDGGDTYASLGPPTVGEGGVVAFHAMLASGGEAIVAVAGVPQVVAATGDTTASGTLCPSGGPSPCFGDPVFGSRGRLLFRAALDNPVATRALLRTTVTTVERPAEVAVDCDAGERLQEAVDRVAGGGMIRVTGTCRENVVVSDVGGVTIAGRASGKGRRRRKAALVADDPARPAFEAFVTAGPTTVTDLVLQGGAPTARLGGTGHVLADVDLGEGGGLVLQGAGHTVRDVGIRKATGPCLVVGATAALVERTLVRRCRSDGVVVTATGASLVRNKVAKSRGGGIVVQGNANTLTRNRMKANRGTGLSVTGRDNTLLGNRATANRKGGIVAAPCNIDAGRNGGRGNRGGPNVRLPRCP